MHKQAYNAETKAAEKLFRIEVSFIIDTANQLKRLQGCEAAAKKLIQNAYITEDVYDNIVSDIAETCKKLIQGLRLCQEIKEIEQ